MMMTRALKNPQSYKERKKRCRERGPGVKPRKERVYAKQRIIEKGTIVEFCAKEVCGNRDFRRRARERAI